MEKAVFLDRDGVINEDVGYAKSIADIKILPDVPKALIKIKEQGYKIFVITNQAVISRGYSTEEDIKKLHEQMNALIVQQGGVPIDRFYLCPHHPNADIIQYRKVCECRKPAHGLILQAAKENLIDLKDSWMLGDRVSDIVAGKNAMCKTILVRSPQSEHVTVSGIAFDKNTKADYEVNTLLEAVEIIESKS